MCAMIVSLGGEARDDLGGKAGRLRQLLGLGLPVPPGFVIPASVFSAAVAALGEDAGARIAHAPLPEGLSAAIREGLAALPPGPVAVRSSGLDEDGEQSSFAGQHHTSLDVSGPEQVEAAVRRCWASAFSASTQAYREASGGGAAPAGMAVLVQRMVRAEAAGVLFSRDPMDGGARVVVEAVPGLGEALVSGRATPDRYTVHRESGARSGEGGCLSAEQVSALVRLGLDLERRLGEPVDLEWAIEGGQIAVLQARPITALPEPAPPYVWASNNAGELFPRVAAPATLWAANVAVNALLGPIFRSFGIDLSTAPMLGLVAGRVYVCMNTFAALIQAVPGFRSRSPAELFGGDAEELSEALAAVPSDQLPDVRVNLLRALAGGARFARSALRQQAVRPDAQLAAVMQSCDALDAAPIERMNAEELYSFIFECFNMDQNWITLLDGIAVGMACYEAVQRLAPRWLGESGNRFFAGMGGVGSAAMALDLWGLVEAGRPIAALRRGDDLATLAPTLSETAEGRAFEAAFQAWMAAHGHRARGEVDVAISRFRERPDQVLAMVRGLLDAPERANPVAIHAAARAERLALEGALDARVGRIKAAILRALIGRGQRGLTLRENAKGALVRRASRCRQVLLELGARLRDAGRLEAADDVLYLEQAELAEAVRDPSLALAGRVRRRRREARSFEALSPPPVVVGRYDPSSAPRPLSAGALLKGLAVSPGLVEGRARVVLATDDEARVLAGEILVAPFTDPGWAPHFVAAAGLVVDSGGMLSHGSIVARELGIPAVVNVGDGTRRIRTGDRIRVDAWRGEVLLLGEG